MYILYIYILIIRYIKYAIVLQGVFSVLCYNGLRLLRVCFAIVALLFGPAVFLSRLIGPIGVARAADCGFRQINLS